MHMVAMHMWLTGKHNSMYAHNTYINVHVVKLEHTCQR
jgi:hypothetical protein